MYQRSNGWNERRHCPFLLLLYAERVEKKYPSIEAASKLTEADLQSSSFQKDITECLAGTWDTGTPEGFLEDCVKTATFTVGAAKAQTYCECMLYKIEKRYPDPVEAGKQLTPEKMNSAEWKKIVQGCRDF